MTTPAAGVPIQLHEIQPREQVGGPTGARFEFQYHEAAADALRVLDDSQVTCVYCEWHDDYVIEASGAIRYQFHQVKDRTASQGPWRLTQFFGIPRQTRGVLAPAYTDSIFAHLYDHDVRFGEECESFVFVTNAGIALDFERLLTGCKAVQALEDLDSGPAASLRSIHGPLAATFASLTLPVLFSFVRRLNVRDAIATPQTLRAARLLIAGRIHELSEVQIQMSESDKIAASLVTMVRERSHRILPSLPSSIDELRATKGLVLADVLGLLSLSSEGYRELKANGRDAVVVLSRLHRLLTRSDVPVTVIPQLCALKANWDAWYITERHTLDPLDYMGFRQVCSDALTQHIQGTLSFNSLREQAQVIASRFQPSFASTTPLTKSLVFGQVLAIAAEAEL